MGIRTTAKKSYAIVGPDEIPGTSLPPTVSLQIRGYRNNLNKFDIIIVVSNALTATLSERWISLPQDGSTPSQIGDKKIFDVKGVTEMTFFRDRAYSTEFVLTAINSIGTSTTLPLIVDPADTSTINLPDEVVSDFVIAREPKTPNVVNIQLSLSIADAFDISKLSGLALIYKNRNAEEFKSINLSIDKYTVSEDENGSESGYVFNFKKQSIIRSNLGGNFDFYIKISFANSDSQLTDKKTLFFDSIDNTSPQRPTDSSISTNIIDIDNPATLRYEITTRFSEVYTMANNSSYVKEEVAVEDSYEHIFLDTNKYKGLALKNYQSIGEDGRFLFYYEYNYPGQENNTKGYFYPASVSEIYPCIITNKDNLLNRSVVLYWKVNDNFFDYTFFENKISITTTAFQVKLQYKNNAGNYVDLTDDPIAITKDPVTMSAKENKKFGFFSKYQKFVLSIERNDVTESVRGIFDRINENDNSGSNLRLLVVKHNVDCYSQGLTRSYSFSKMLMPPEWKYIAYDKYIPNDTEIRTDVDKKINLDLNSEYLRGIKLPESGFYKYDQLSKLKKQEDKGALVEFNFKILYKLSCDYDVFYQDPILEGTVNSVLLPSVPKDVFLIAPTLEIPPPNFTPESAGGKQAEGIATINEYGKIVGLQITDPGHGYSLFKTAQSKREQSFTDLIPFVKKYYKIVASDLNINREVLVLQNNSFDKSNLKASLKGGVRLASAYADKQRLDQNGGNSFSVEQKTKLDEYLNNYLPQESSDAENSVKPYDVTYTVAEKDISSIGILDETWNIISKLYADKYINPMQESKIYTEDTDAGVSEIEESSVPSTINGSKDSISITATSLNPEVEQKSADGGSPELFSLNNLTVVPDASAAVSIASKFAPPPSLTLLPLSVRADGQYGFGPLPNMAPRAEMFNRLVMGINNLNEVRVMLPMIWAVDSTNSVIEWYSVDTEPDRFKLIDFSASGTKSGGEARSSDYFPINSILAAGSSKSVARTNLYPDVARDLGLSQGMTYKLSTDSSTTQSFKPFIHPLMSRSFKESYLKTFKRRLLGIVTESTTSCANNIAPTDAGGSAYVGASYPVPIGTTYPIENVNSNVYFQFFDSGGTIETTSPATAQSLSLPNGQVNGVPVFFDASCGDAYSKSIDFTYANMFPGTIRI